MIFSDEESKAWIEKLSYDEKFFMTEAINKSNNSSELKESLIAIIKNPDILVQKEGVRAEVRKKILNYQEKDRSKDMEVLITNY